MAIIFVVTLNQDVYYIDFAWTISVEAAEQETQSARFRYRISSRT